MPKTGTYWTLSDLKTWLFEFFKPGLKPFTRGYNKFLSLQFDSHDHSSEFRFIQFYQKTLKRLKARFSSLEPAIELVDPQQRLEEGIAELGRLSQADLRSARENLTQRLDETEQRLANSQQRIENCLVEMSCKTTSSFEATQEDASTAIALVHDECLEIKRLVRAKLAALSSSLATSVGSLRLSLRDSSANWALKLLANQKSIEAKLDMLLMVSTANQVSLDQEKSHGQRNINGMTLSLADANLKMDKSMEKLSELASICDSHQKNDDKLAQMLVDIKVNSLPSDFTLVLNFFIFMIKF